MEKRIPEVSDARAHCPNPGAWNCYDGMSSEIEVIDFLGALTRLIKPQLIVETGTFHGRSTLSMAMALRENGFGRLYSLDVDPESIKIASERCQDYPEAEILQRSSLDYEPVGKINLLFCDSELHLRATEILHFLPWMDERSIIAVHDTGNHRPRPLNDLEKLRNDGVANLIHFDTPRGLSLLQLRPGYGGRK